MPSANISASNMSQLVRDTYQANGLIKSQSQSALESSQSSLQKLPASSPQFLYQQLNFHQQQLQQQQQQQSQQSMQFQAPPMQTQQQQQPSNNVNHSPVPLQNIVQQHQGQLQQQQPNRSATESVASMNNQYNQMIVPQHQHQQQQFNQNLALNILSMNAGLMPANMNGASQNQLLIPPFMSAKGAHMQQPAGQGAPVNQQFLQQQHPTYMTQQQILAAGQQHAQNQQQQAQLSQQQQVPMTTIMIPATTASQLQAISMQIQQAAMQAAGPNSQNTPQILVFMIPYMWNPNNLQVPSMPITPEQPSLNSTLVRQSRENSSIIRRSQQQQKQQPTQINSQQQQQQQQQQSHQNPPTAANSTSSHSRAVSSLSNNTSSTLAAKQEPEKFYVKANFSYRASRNRQALSFERGEILHVLDTLQNNDYGVQFWLATRVNHNGEDTDKGLIPNKNKAEEIAIEQRTMEIGERANGENGGGVVGRVNFLKRRSAQRSKSLSKDNWDNVVFDIGTFRLPTYERVVFKHPGFCRPVVIFGPLADLAREKLLKDYPEKYSYPNGISQSPQHPKVIRLKGVLDVIDQGKHALLDITAQAVEKLNYVNLAPIVIFMKTESKSIIKEFRTRAAESLDPSLARDEDTLRRDAKSSRKLLEQSMQLEKQWSHVFTAILDLSTMGSEMWYRKLREIIENQQSANVWMGDKRSSERRQQTSATASSSNLSAHGAATESPYSTSSNSRNSNHHQHQHASHQQQLQQTASCLADNSSMLSEKFSECLNLTTAKSTNDLLPLKESGIYGNRSKLRNDYVHSLAQKLARASSEPKLNGAMSEPEDEDDDHDESAAATNELDENERVRLMQHQKRVSAPDDEEDDEDDDEIVKKPLFPSEHDNPSSISSNGMASSTGGLINFGQFSLSGAGSSASANHLQSAPYQQQTSTSYQMHLAPQQLAPHHHIPQGQSKPPAPLPPQALTQAQAQALHTAMEKQSEQQKQQHLNYNQSAASRSMIPPESIYSMNNGGGSVIGVDSFMPMVQPFSAASGAAQLMSRSRDYHPLPPMGVDNGYYQQQQLQSLTGSGQTNGSTGSNSSASHTDSSTPTCLTGKNVEAKSGAENHPTSSHQSAPIDLARNHETRGSAFHIYSDMNQNNYHYFNVNNI